DRAGKASAGPGPRPVGKGTRRQLRRARLDAELRRTDVQGLEPLQRGAPRRVDVHPVVIDVVEAAVVRDHPGGVAHHDRARRYRPADDGSGADDGVVANGDAADDHRMRADEDPIADGWRAAVVASTRDADGDVLRQAAVMADARFRRDDDRAVVPDVNAVADLALRRNADAGDDLDELLRRQHERGEERAAP